ncbi:hypothetical protein AVEN_72136-1 [Araneus ventricosus]|uniref:Uncharacterized protein n=1 Tax=Araneus ventricosus TaxID=182803 RepID=A0A4Y2JIN6_ARAVE|nr:hypothetical protein AVEN_72136-1 [Araneus ventricosus]
MDGNKQFWSTKTQSHFIQTGIFATRVGKSDRQFKYRWKLAYRNGNAGIQRNSKYNTSCADSNLEPRCEASGTSKDLPTLRPRVEGGNETRNPPRRRRGR